MTTPRTRIATTAAAVAVTLLALGGTALALGNTVPTPTAPAVATPAVPVPVAPTVPAPTVTGPTVFGPTLTTPAPPAVAGAEDATTAALRATGGGRIVSVEREFEHGRAEWKVVIDRDGVRREVRVDAATATVTRTDDDGGSDASRSGGSSGRGGHDDGPNHR
ncbi:PepSY domain-containing protein [Pseudonocardia sp. GCM10023141]|uniref:PepSY domain-containing protein n=1 Tax=Pseudonocardia sp. GCM10023141 TaxID=3252653 RepID=UPI0036228020